MIGRFLRFTIVGILLFTVNGLGQSFWVKTYGGGGREEGRSLSVTSDNNFYVTGYSGSKDGNFIGLNKGGDDIFITKFDSDGNEIWKKVFGGWKSDFGNSIITTKDQGCIITGTTLSNDGDFGGLNKGGQDIILIKLDRNGKVLWKKTFGGSSDDIGQSIVYDGRNYLVIGNTMSKDGDFTQNYGFNDLFLIKIDEEGKIIWSKNYGGTSEDIGYSISVTNDSCYIFTGYTISNDKDFYEMRKGNSDIFTMKTDSNGNIIWKKTYGGSKHEQGRCIRSTNDGGHIMTGLTFSNDGDFREMNKDWTDMFVIKIDSIGNLLWKKTFGGTQDEVGNSLYLKNDNEIIVVGQTNSINGDFSGLNKTWTYSDIIVLKLDSLGELLWKKGYGGSINEVGLSVNQTVNGNLIVVGGTDSNDGDIKNLNKGLNDIIVMKLDSNGNLNNTTSINEYSEPPTTLSVHPNPFSNSTTVSYKVNTPSNVRIELLNPLGQTIEVLREDYTDIGTFQLPLNVSTLSSGMYSVRMRSGSMNEVVPVWVVR